jgi:hypothetical protein
MGEKTNAWRALVGKREGKRLLGKPRCNWTSVCKWFLNKQDENVWSGLVWLRAVLNTVVNLRV